MGRAKNCRSLASQFAETVLTEGLGGLQSRIRAKFSWASSQDFHPSLFPHLRLGGTVFTVIDGSGKDNISAMDNSSEAIFSLQPVTFRYKRD